MYYHYQPLTNTCSCELNVPTLEICMAHYGQTV